MTSERRDSAWLRKTLCDEIESLREGSSDHVRAKGVAMLAREVLKSVEVEMVFRQQQSELTGTEQETLGALPLCASAPALSGPQEGPDLAPDLNLVAEPTDTNVEVQDEPETEPQPAQATKDEPQELEISEVSGFKVGDRVMCPNGKRGTVEKVRSSGRIDVSEDTGGTFPYTARHLERLTTPSAAPIRSPIVPQGLQPRFVAGRNASGGR